MAIKGKPDDIIGRDADGRPYRAYTSAAWGTFSPVPMVEPNPTISSATERTLKLPDNLPRFPRHLFQPLLSLYFELMREGGGESREVSAVLLRKDDDPSVWRVIVPEQEVGKASVRARFAKCRDLITGELLSFPVDGWYHAGSTHSHNDMGAFFSDTDNASELPMPGLHFVVGNLNKDKRTYDVAASIVLRNTRFIYPWRQLIDLEWDASTPTAFSRDVLSLVTEASRASLYASAGAIEARDWFTDDEMTLYMNGGGDDDISLDDISLIVTGPTPPPRGVRGEGRWWRYSGRWENIPLYTGNRGSLIHDDSGWGRMDDGSWVYDAAKDLRPEPGAVDRAEQVGANADVGAWHRGSRSRRTDERRSLATFLSAHEVRGMSETEVRHLYDVYRELNFLQPTDVNYGRVLRLFQAWGRGSEGETWKPGKPGGRETRPRFPLGDSGGE